MKMPRVLAISLFAIASVSIGVYASSFAPTGGNIALQSSIREMTMPVMNVSGMGGYAIVETSWYGGLQPYEELVYRGNSPTCAFDVMLFNDTNDVILPPNPMGYNPKQEYVNWIWINASNESNSFYYCAVINDSRGKSSKTNYAVFINMADYLNTTTTSTPTTSAASTSSIPTTAPTSTTPSVPAATVYTTIPSANSSAPGGSTPGSGTICYLPEIPAGCTWVSTANSTAPCAGHVACPSTSTASSASSPTVCSGTGPLQTQCIVETPFDSYLNSITGAIGSAISRIFGWLT